MFKPNALKLGSDVLNSDRLLETKYLFTPMDHKYYKRIIGQDSGRALGMDVDHHFGSG